MSARVRLGSAFAALALGVSASGAFLLPKLGSRGLPDPADDGRVLIVDEESGVKSDCEYRETV